MDLVPPRLSVCIPAYNRPEELLVLLESVANQGNGDWNVVICEDKSPRALEIAEAVRGVSLRNPELRISYFSNEKNLGYDGNLRRLLDNADGEYCLFMGDDDVLVPGSLKRISDALAAFPDVGFVLRAWKSVDKETGKDIEEYRYFDGDRFFPSGIESIAALYRRSVFISGLAVHRQIARGFHTDRFDGLLLYQLYLVGRILMEMKGLYISDIIAIRRVGGEHYFGSSDKEKGRFQPKQLLPQHSITFLKGLFDIAQALDVGPCPGVFKLISHDLSRHSYPMLEIQAQRLNRKEFRDYALKLAELGLGNYNLFWIYYQMISFLGPDICNVIIRSTKRLLGHTPSLGGSKGITAQ